MNKVKIKYFSDKAKVPIRATNQAGAYDVFCTEVIKENGHYVRCKIGLGFQPSKAHRIMLIPRSSITKTGWILSNSIGLGDADYLGEYEFRFRALPVYDFTNVELKADMVFPDFPYKVGDRIGQIFLEAVLDMDFVEEKFEETERGEGGYGSTGK